MVIFISILYVLFPIISSVFALGMYLRSNKYSKYYAVLFSFGLSLIAYNIIPVVGFDYYVYVQRMELFHGKNLFNAFNLVEGFTTEPLSNLLFYTIAQTNNYRLLSLVATFISYSILLLIYDSYAKENKISSIVKFTVLLMVFSWVYFISIATGIRFSLGIVFILLGIYREFHLNKNPIGSLVIYFMATLFHVALYPFLLIRVLTSFYKGRLLKKIIAFLLCTWSFYQIGIIKLLNLVPYDILKERVIERFVIYENEYVLGTSINAVIYHNLKWVYVIIVIFSIYSISKSKDIRTEKFKNIKYFNTLKLMAFFTVGSMGNQLFSGRYIMMLMLLTTPAVFNFIQHSKFKRMKPLFIYGCMIYSFIGLYVQVLGLAKLRWYISPIEQLVHSVFRLLIY